jgi:8-oxo-dGTP pyrophosphatase MutT (NUDIX family)
VSNDPYAFVLPYAREEDTAKVLLGERQMIQRRVAGQEVRGIIPDWAGQWVIIGGQGKSGEAPHETAQRTLREQTGINLADDRLVKTYGVVKQQLVSLKDTSYNSFYVLYLTFTAGDLDAFKNVIVSALHNIPSTALWDGVLQAAEVYRQPSALTQVGPVNPPKDGWRNYLVRNYYGGTNPGPFNLEIGELTNLLTQRSAQDATWFTIGINNLPKSDAPLPPSGTVVTTAVSLVNTTPADLWLSATIASESDWGSTVNRPDVNIGGGTTSAPTLAAFGSLMAIEDILSTATSARYTITVTFEVPIETGVPGVVSSSFSFEVNQTEARSGEATEASTRNLNIQGDPSGIWAVRQVGESPPTRVGMRGLTLYLFTPNGS